MYRKSVNPIVSKAIVDALLGALPARPAAALMLTPNVHLFVNDFTPNQGSVLADFTDATFTGGAAQAQGALSGPVWLDDQTRAVLANNVFLCTADPSPGQVVYGYFVTDTTDAILWVFERFADPVAINVAGDFLNLDYIFPENMLRQTGQLEL